MARKMKDSGVEWIGEIPEEWKVTKLKNIVKFQNGYAFDSKTLKNYGKFPVVRIGDIHNGKVDFDSANRIDSNEGLEQYAILEGDTVIAMSGATVGKLAYVDSVDGLSYINQRVGIIRTESKFVYYYLSTDEFLKYIFLLAAGSAQPNISTESIFNYKITVQNNNEKNEIVRFLDKKVCSVNRVIEETKNVVSEYKDYKRSLITKAVSRGLQEVKLKKTKNIHIPEIPDTWEMKKLKYVFHIKKAIVGETGYDVLSITQKGIKVKDITNNAGQLATDYSNYQRVNVGDFAMNHMDLLTGWVDVSEYNGVTSPDYRVFNFISEKGYSRRYYLYLMQMCYMNRIFYGLGQGVSNLGRWRLQADKFLNFTIPVPAIEEQEEIAQYLDVKCGEIDKIIAEKEALVSELESYKKSLIYEYVTGKKEVPAENVR